MKGSGIREPM